MSRYERQILRAPAGMNTVADAAALPPDRARSVVGFYPARHAELTPVPALEELVRTRIGSPARSLLGIAYYRSAKRPDALSAPYAYDRLLFADAFGFLYVCRVGFDPAEAEAHRLILGPAAMIGNFSVHGGGLGRIRSVQVDDELYFVTADGSPLYRYRANDTDSSPYEVFELAGLPAPTLTSVAAGASGSVDAGTHSYKVTLFDDKGRESSPSSAETVTLASADAVDVAFTLPETPGRGWSGAYIYRTLAGGSEYFRTGSVSLTPASPLSQTFEDTNADADIAENANPPNPGQNDRPYPGNILCVHKNRLFLNMVKSSGYSTPGNEKSLLQISNYNAPSQFASAPIAATDGDTLIIGSDPGDEITGLATFGSLLGIWKRNSYWVLLGDSVADFSPRQVHSRGCIAPDSVVHCDNVIAFLSDDGPYAMSFQDGYTMKPIGGEIESLFRGYIQK